MICRLRSHPDGLVTFGHVPVGGVMTVLVGLLSHCALLRLLLLVRLW
jgi:hypothetical protein